MAADLEEIAAQIRAIACITLTVHGSEWKIGAEFSDEPKIAIKQIRLTQKQLRAVKTQLNARMKLIRADYRQQISDATYRPGIGGALLGARYRRAMRSGAARTKDLLRTERDRALAPYEQVKAFIDRVLIELDIQKAGLQS